MRGTDGRRRIDRTTAAVTAAVVPHRSPGCRRSATGTQAPRAERPLVAAPVETQVRSWPRQRLVPLLLTAIALQLSGGVVAAIGLDRASALPASTQQETSDVAAVPDPAGEAGISPPAPTAVAQPVGIDIPRLGTSAPIDEIGLDGDGALAVPEDFHRAGWYSGLEAPGESGTAVIVGHLDSYTGPGVFFEVPQLRAGDEILVRLADGSTERFLVERTEQYDKRDFPTIAVYGPTDRPTLRLITCGGTFDDDSRSYSDNVVVYASAEEAP